MLKQLKLDLKLYKNDLWSALVIITVAATTPKGGWKFSEEGSNFHALSKILGLRFQQT